MQTQHAKEAPLAKHKHLILGLAVALWLIGTAIGLWWFQSQNIRSFLDPNQPPPAAPEVEQQLHALVANHADAVERTAPVTLLHFWNPDCLCNQVSQRHFDGLLAKTSAEELEIVVVAPASASAETLAEFRRLNPPRIKLMQLESDEFRPSSSPSMALVNNRDGAGKQSSIDGYELGYYGAYGFGALCTVASDDFFPNIVRKMTAGSYGPFLNVAGSGCFCEWP